jgi:hypothetical protein
VAKYGNRQIVRKLIDANAAVNSQSAGGCAFPAVVETGSRPVTTAVSTAVAVCRAGPCRCTVAAKHGDTDLIEELLVSGADVAFQNSRG